MAEQRITQEVLLEQSENTAANIRLTQAGILGNEVNTNANERLTQIVFLENGVNTAANAFMTQITWLTITPRLANDCAQSWTIPTIDDFPFPSESGPQYIYFNEIAPTWGNFGQSFSDGTPAFASIQTARIRRFEIEYDGLDQADAAVLDDHWESTVGGLPFTITHPRTAETITNVRYESYTRSGHRRLWSQSRSVILVKYTN